MNEVSAAATDASTMVDATTPPRENVIRRMYRWVMSWAETPYGTPALAAISFAESSFFPIPPDVLQIGLSVARPKWSYFYAAVNTAASVAGGIFGWMIGVWFWAAVGWFFFAYVPGFKPEVFNYVRDLYHQNAFLTILAAAFTPIPYKVITIAAGVFDVSLWVLFIASLIGRGARFFLVGTLIFWFGERVRLLIEKYFELATVVFFVLVVGGFVVLKLLTH